MRTHRRKATKTSPTRIALLEIVNPDPFHPYRAHLFPYVKGLSCLPGVQVRWLRVGVQTHPRCFTPEILPEDVTRVLERLRTFHPTHLYVNVQPDPSLRRCIDALVPTPVLVVADSPDWRRNLEGFWQLLERLGLREIFDSRYSGCINPTDELMPDYHAENLNPAAEDASSRFEIQVGQPCTHCRPLARNPYYVSLTAFAAWRGCTFCRGADDPPVQSRLASMDLLFRHLHAAVESLPSGGPRPTFNLVGSFAFLHLSEFFRRLLARPFPPSRFLFTCRVDEFLRRADTLEEFLPRIGASGHTAVIHSVGVENFSATENERMNKGISIGDFEAFHARLLQMKSAYPEAIDFPASWTFGFILFTPWTTLEDLEVNLREARRFGMDLGGQFLASRLQLLPGRPITELARLDGLLVESPEDLPFFSGCIRSAHVSEIPWRFRCSEVAVTYAVMRRLVPSADIPDDDPLFQTIQRWLLLLPMDVLTVNRLADLLVEAARQGHTRDPSDLLEGCLRLAFCRAAEDGDGSRPQPVSPARLVRTLGRILSVRPDYLFDCTVAGVEVEMPWTRLELRGQRGTLHLALTPVSVQREAFARSERYAVCIEGDATPTEDWAAAVTRHVARLLDAFPRDQRASLAETPSSA